MTCRYLVIIFKIWKETHERISRNLVSKSLRVDRDPPRSAKSQVGQIAKKIHKFSGFRGLLGRYASVTDHIAPGCSPHVCYEPAKDEDHRPTGDRVGLARNPALQPASPLLSTTVAIHWRETEIDRNRPNFFFQTFFSTRKNENFQWDFFKVHLHNSKNRFRCSYGGFKGVIDTRNRLPKNSTKTNWFLTRVLQAQELY